MLAAGFQMPLQVRRRKLGFRGGLQHQPNAKQKQIPRVVRHCKAWRTLLGMTARTGTNAATSTCATFFAARKNRKASGLPTNGVGTPELQGSVDVIRLRNGDGDGAEVYGGPGGQGLHGELSGNGVAAACTPTTTGSCRSTCSAAATRAGSRGCASASCG